MGQKVNPHGLRVGIIKEHDAQWYANKKDFSGNLIADDKIRKFLKDKYYKAGISKITVERAASKVIINIHTGRPAVLIGKAGAGVEEIKNEVQKFCDAEKSVIINIMEVKRPDADAQLVAEVIAEQLENRASFRRSMKQAMTRALNKGGARGIKTMVSGRLDGAEIARSESYHEGSIPLQTLRADIDYGFAEAHTTFGVIGVKCWIYKGEILGGKQQQAQPQQPAKEGGNN
ncbi:MAG: 30S ribosomal protein S3 [Clostridiaceae bacterium]|jgi:small subunit ribosomal protein S3|nr:30S ribosomal protein S3 [Clostridiaceae bacterium]